MSAIAFSNVSALVRRWWCHFRSRSHGARRLVALREQGALFTRHVRPCGYELRVLAGTVWVTEEGAPEDIILYAGDSYRATSAGLLAAQALAASTLVSELQG